MRLCLFLLLLTGCVSDQNYRVQKEDHVQQHTEEAAEEKAYREKQHERDANLSSKSANKAAERVHEQYKETLENSLKVHRTAVQNDTEEALDGAWQEYEKRWKGLVRNLQEMKDAFQEYLRVTSEQNEKREKKEERHVLQIEEKIKGIDSRVTATHSVIMLNAVADTIASDKRDKAIKELADARTRIKRLELDVLDLRDDNRKKKEEVEKADDKAGNAKWIAILTLVLGFAVKALELLISHRKKKESKKGEE